MATGSLIIRHYGLKNLVRYGIKIRSSYSPRYRKAECNLCYPCNFSKGLRKCQAVWKRSYSRNSVSFFHKYAARYVVHSTNVSKLWTIHTHRIRIRTCTRGSQRRCTRRSRGSSSGICCCFAAAAEQLVSTRAHPGGERRAGLGGTWTSPDNAPEQADADGAMEMASRPACPQQGAYDAGPPCGCTGNRGAESFQ